MAKGQFLGAISRAFCRAGEAIRFRPESTFAPPRSDSETDKKGTMPFLAYRLRVKSSLAKMCEQSLILSLVSTFVQRIFRTRVRSFGVLFFVCGFLQILSYFLGGYVPLLAGNEDNLIFGVSLIFLTLLCSFTRGDVRDALKRSFLFRKVLSALFGVDATQLPAGRSKDYSAYMVSFGALLALFSVIFSPVGVAGVIFGLVLVLFVCHRPEAGLVTAAIGLLFVSERTLFFLSVLTLASFLAKCAVGKRSLVFALRDCPVVFALVLLGLSRSALTAFLLVSFYVLGLGLLRNLAWIRRFLMGLTLGGVLCASLFVLRFLIETFVPTGFLAGVLRFDFLSKESAALLSLIAPLSAGFFRSERRSSARLWSLFSFILYAVAVFTAGSFGARLAFVASFLLLFAFSHRFALLFLVELSLVAATLFYILPAFATERVYRFFGFSEEGSLWLQGALSTELFPTLILLGVFLYFVISFRKKATRPEPFSQVLGGVGSLLSLLIVGFLSVFSDAGLFVLFAFLLLLPRVALRASAREEIRLPY